MKDGRKTGIALAVQCALGLLLALPAQAVEFRSLAEPSLLYDAPSQKGVRLFIASALTPVELVVNLEGWSKVRDASGTLAWVERKHLAELRTVQVVGERAQVREAPDEAAALSFEAEAGVALEFLEMGPAGWIRVKHRDGATGFVRAPQIWGL